MGGQPAAESDPGSRLLALYETALPQVYGYLLTRCGRPALAEDLTAETFLAAVDAIRGAGTPPVSTAWLIGVARHKLVDHWRARAREERGLRAVADPSTWTTPAGQPAGTVGAVEDPWDVYLDALRARDTLSRLAPQHRAALTLRYLDDLPVGQVAGLLGRTVHATEALLVRARVAFRRDYTDHGGEGDGGG
ncbi:MAG TPA: RNA polymerase sigma factor [Mycobacteriales bacterium]|nr:RNA polymerase sigma factor [Mycobacteriales bacterium]